jgi:hypothetical protein
MRYIFTGLLLLSALTMTACSYPVDFAVINGSAHPVQITYRIAETGVDSLGAVGRPAILPASSIDSRKWQELSPAEFSFDGENRVVTVSLQPGQALRVYRGGQGAVEPTGGDFIIRELNVRGMGGEVTFKGNQVHRSFVPVPRPFYAFGPDTALLTLTYQ